MAAGAENGGVLHDGEDLLNMAGVGTGSSDLTIRNMMSKSSARTEEFKSVLPEQTNNMRQNAGRVFDSHDHLLDRLDRLCTALEERHCREPDTSPKSAVRTLETDLAIDGETFQSHSMSKETETDVSRGEASYSWSITKLASSEPPSAFRNRLSSERSEVKGWRATSAPRTTGSARSTNSRLVFDQTFADPSLLWIEPHYDEAPTLEVTMKVYSLSCLNVNKKCFNADFAVTLDWTDRALKYRRHFFDREIGSRRESQFVIPPSLEHKIFNPRVIVENAVGDLAPMTGSDLCPRVGCLIDGELHLTKTMRFRGVLICPKNDLTLFPFDFQTLRIQLKSLHTDVTGERCPKLVGPVIRRSSIVTHRPGMSKTGHIVDADNISLGELQLWKWGPLTHRSLAIENEYALVLGFKRQSSQYWFDFIIQVVMIFLGLMTAYIDPAEEESLANRLNICVVLVLTLVTFSLERPQAVNGLPYSTIHDLYRRSFVLILVALAVFVCSVPVFCQSQLDMDKCRCCHWCGATTYDCMNACATLVVVVTFHVVLVIGVKVKQAALELSFDEKLIDESSGRASFSQPKAAEILQSTENLGAFAALDSLKSVKKLCRCCCCCCHRRTIHPLNLEGSATTDNFRSRTCFGGSIAGSHEENVPPVLSGTNCFFLDIGGGEIGLYGYGCDAAQGPWSEGGRKLSFNINGALEEIHRNGSGKDDGPRLQCQTLIKHIANELRLMGVENLATSSELAPPAAKRSDLIVGFTKRNAAHHMERGEAHGSAEIFAEYIEKALRAEGLDVGARVFVPNDALVAGLELCAVEFLLQHAEFPFRMSRLEESRSGLGNGMESHYLEQVAAWLKVRLQDGILTKCRKIGKCTAAEFVRSFIDLPLAPTPERTAQELMQYFDERDEEGHRELSWGTLVSLILGNQALLQAVVRERLFAGTLSVGAATCHIARQGAPSRSARKGDVQNNMLALHTLPVGSQDAVKLSYFPENRQIAAPEIEAWRRAVRQKLEEEKRMQRNLPGLFVGISGAWYAAHESGIRGDLMPLPEVLQRINRRLSNLLEADPQTPTHHRSMSNLVLVSELLEFALSKESWLLFRREWDMPSGSIVANWSFGWYLLGESACEDWGQLHRVHT